LVEGEVVELAEDVRDAKAGDALLLLLLLLLRRFLGLREGRRGDL